MKLLQVIVSLVSAIFFFLGGGFANCCCFIFAWLDIDLTIPHMKTAERYVVLYFWLCIFFFLLGSRMVMVFRLLELLCIVGCFFY